MRKFIKTRTKVITTIIALILSIVLVFTVVAVSNNTGKTFVADTPTRTVALTESSIDAQSILDEFDDAVLTKVGTTTYFEGSKPLDKDLFSEIDYIGEADFDELEDCIVRYYVSYDESNDLVSLTAIMDNGDGAVIGDTLYGVVFINGDGETDALMEIDGEYNLLSEMQELGLIQNCGWFKKLIAAVVTTVVVTAAVAAIMATGGAALGAVVGVCTAVGAAVGGVTSVIVGAIDGEVSFGQICANFGAGLVVGAATGALTGLIVGKIASYTVAFFKRIV